MDLYSKRAKARQPTSKESANPASLASSPSPIRELPELIQDETQLNDVLTSPRQVLVDFIQTIASPLVVLGAGGKMGPTLAALAKRAAAAARSPLEVLAVSRFSDPATKRWLESQGVATLEADLLAREAAQDLPDAGDVIYLVGLKFGTRQSPWLSWAVNTLVPAHILERYPAARIVALSTGNVYSMVPTRGSGASEDHSLTPLGEYANAAVARERLFEYFSRKQGTRVALIRLNYAVELRYGVLLDVARKVLQDEPVDLSTPCFNCIWQGDANEMILRCLALAAAPASAWNLTGPAILRVRDVAQRFGGLLGKTPSFAGEESDTALISNPARLCGRLGDPPTSLEQVLRWTAHWVKQGGRQLNKPTHFEVRDGQY